MLMLFSMQPVCTWHWYMLHTKVFLAFVPHCRWVNGTTSSTRLNGSVPSPQQTIFGWILVWCFVSWSIHLIESHKHGQNTAFIASLGQIAACPWCGYILRMPFYWLIKIRYETKTRFSREWHMFTKVVKGLEGFHQVHTLTNNNVCRRSIFKATILAQW